MKNLKGFCTFAVMAIIALFVWDLSIDRDFALFNYVGGEDLSISKLNSIFLIGLLFSAILFIYFFLSRNSSYKTAARIGIFATLIGFVGFLLLYANLEDLIKFDGSEYKSELARTDRQEFLQDNVGLGRMFATLGYMTAMIAAAASLIGYARTSWMKRILVGLTLVYMLPFILVGTVEYFEPDRSDYMEKTDSYYGHDFDYETYEDDREDYYDNWETIAKILHYLQFVGWGLFFFFHEKGMQPLQIEEPVEPVNSPEEQKQE